MTQIRLNANDLVNYSEAARLLGVTRVTVYAMIARGEFHPVEIVDRRYLLKHEVGALAEKRKE